MATICRFTVCLSGINGKFNVFYTISKIIMSFLICSYIFYRFKFCFQMVKSPIINSLFLEYTSCLKRPKAVLISSNHVASPQMTLAASFGVDWLRQSIPWLCQVLHWLRQWHCFFQTTGLTHILYYNINYIID